MEVLVIAEHNNNVLMRSTLNVINAALQLKGRITVLVVGHGCSAVAEAVSSAEGVDRVVLMDDAVYEHQLAENLSRAIASLAMEYAAILGPATTFGKDVMPRLAAMLNLPMVSDVIAIHDAQTFSRPIYAGNAVAMVKNHAKQQLLTIRPTAFDVVEQRGSPAPIVKHENRIAAEKTQFIAQRLSESERPELTTANVVISGGRGLQEAANFKLLEALADKLNGAVGASRAAVDAEFVPNDYQVGQTGKVVAPDLYVAIGISGAIQHIAGMKDSKVIVAINKDEDAPIFEVADYGFVGDLFTAVPALIEELEKVNKT